MPVVQSSPTKSIVISGFGFRSAFSGTGVYRLGIFDAETSDGTTTLKHIATMDTTHIFINGSTTPITPTYVTDETVGPNNFTGFKFDWDMPETNKPNYTLSFLGKPSFGLGATWFCESGVPTGFNNGQKPIGAKTLTITQ